MPSDNGGNYVSKAFFAYLVKDDIGHQLTLSDTPAQNGVAEIAKRTMKSKARAMMQEERLSGNIGQRKVMQQYI